MDTPKCLLSSGSQLRVVMVPLESIWECMWRGQGHSFGCYNEGNATILNLIVLCKNYPVKRAQSAPGEKHHLPISFLWALDWFQIFVIINIHSCSCILDDSRGEIMDQSVSTFYSLFIHIDKLFSRNTWCFSRKNPVFSFLSLVVRLNIFLYVY